MSSVLLESAQTQEIPRPSMVRQRRIGTRTETPNFRLGKVELTADATLRVEYVDNVDQTSIDPTGDFLIRPELGLRAAWPITQLNTLELRAAFGYTKYLDHPQLDSQSLTIAPDSALKFTLYTGDFRIEFQDRFSYQTETSNVSSLNGVASLPRFTNTAGVNVLWDLNDVVSTLGYNHYNFITLGSAVDSQGNSQPNLSQLDHSTDQVSASSSWKLNASTLLGLEGTVSSSAYPDAPQSDYTAFSAGPQLDIQLTRYSHMLLAAGYKGYSFQETEVPMVTQTVLIDPGTPTTIRETPVAGETRLVGTKNKGLQVRQPLTIRREVIPGRSPKTETRVVTPPTSDAPTGGYYVNLALVHRLNRYYSDRLEVGHEDQVDSFSGRTETNYVRYSSSWVFNRFCTVSLGLSVEDIHQAAGNASRAVTQADYRYFSGSIGTSYQLTRHVNLSIAYQHTQKLSSETAQNYSQNRLSLGVSYLF